jgi:hypothetical protein
LGNIFSENPTWSIGIIFTLLGIIWVHRLLDKRNITQNIRPCILEFKSAFKSKISNDRGIGKFYLGDMASGFIANQSAVQDIMPVLPKRYQRKLKKAWDEYTGKSNGLGYEREEYVKTMWACVELGKPEISDNIEKKFHRLFRCLDDFIK